MSEADYVRQWCETCEQILETYWHNSNDFPSPKVTMQENWLYNYDPDTKQQPMEWLQKVTPRPKILRIK